MELYKKRREFGISLQKCTSETDEDTTITIQARCVINIQLG